MSRDDGAIDGVPPPDPLGDDAPAGRPEPSRPPSVPFHEALARQTPRTFVTGTLLAANAAVFAAMLAAGVPWANPGIADLVRFGANDPALTRAGETWRLLTSTFVHIGLPHLLMNLYVLYQVGPTTERLFGNAPFAVTYLLAGLAGSLASTVVDSASVTAGASGAVFGLFGALLAFAARQRHTLPPGVAKALARSAALFVVLNVAIAAAVPGISQSSHLGGLAGGFACGLALARPVTGARAAGRGRRATAVLVAGIALAAAGAYVLRRDDAAGAVERFARNESRALEAWRAIHVENATAPLSQTAYADRIEREVLGPWREALRALSGLERVSEDDRRRLAPVRAYAAARVAQYEATVVAVRTGSAEATVAARTREAEAERLLRGLRPPGE